MTDPTLPESTTVQVAPQPMSSVELEQTSKGTRCTVKVYAATVIEAAALAQAQYDSLVARYRAEAQ